MDQYLKLLFQSIRDLQTIPDFFLRKIEKQDMILSKFALNV